MMVPLRQRDGTIMAPGSCAGCGGPLPPRKRASAPATKWCSDRCRKGQYAGSCIDCGAPTNGYDGPGKACARCLSCSRRYPHENRHWTPGRIIEALRELLRARGELPPAASPEGTALQTAATREFGSWNKAVAAAGLTPRPAGHYGRPLEKVPTGELVARYLAGEGTTAIARDLGVSPDGVRMRLRRAGVRIRSASEAGRLRWDRRRDTA